MINFLKMLSFSCARKQNRDYAGWWKVQTGLVILIYTQLLSIILVIAEGCMK